MSTIQNTQKTTEVNSNLYFHNILPALVIYVYCIDVWWDSEFGPYLQWTFRWHEVFVVNKFSAATIFEKKILVFFLKLDEKLLKMTTKYFF